MTVFVVHGVRDDISPARKFGSLSLINHAYIHGDELERRDGNNVIPRTCFANIMGAVGAFNPVTDFLLIAGDHLQLLAMTAILAAKFPSFMVLRYDRQLNDYIPVRLHSGLVPPPVAVVGSGTDIGDHEHGEDRSGTPSGWDWKTNQRENLDAVRAGLEAPLSRRDPDQFGGPRSKRPA